LRTSKPCSNSDASTPDNFLVAIKPPDAVEIRLTGSCNGCPASGQTLTEGVEKSIRERYPEIATIHLEQFAIARTDEAAQLANDGGTICQIVPPMRLQSALIISRRQPKATAGGFIYQPLRLRRRLLQSLDRRLQAG
jgi:hypothetical protein